jgi:hypothetical protein
LRVQVEVAVVTKPPQMKVGVILSVEVHAQPVLVQKDAAVAHG